MDVSKLNREELISLEKKIDERLLEIGKEDALKNDEIFIEVGKKYQTRNGDEVLIRSRNKDVYSGTATKTKSKKIADINPEVYANGRRKRNLLSSGDLIKEI